MPFSLSLSLSPACTINPLKSNPTRELSLKRILPPKISLRPFRYDVWRLVNRQNFSTAAQRQHPVHIISDIDKTYLETSYGTLKSMAKIALEDASEKQTVAGSRELLRALKWPSPFTVNGISPPLHFVSSSPPQLRGVLEQKISRDRLLCASNSFKDQIYNIKKGKLSLLKHQISYKLASILSLLNTLENTQKLLLIGDDAESDPLVYAWIKFAFEPRHWDRDESVKALQAFDVRKEFLTTILAAVDWPLPAINNVVVAIRRIKPLEGQQVNHQAPHHHQHHELSQPRAPKRCAVGRELIWFSDYTELALKLYSMGWLNELGWNQYCLELDHGGGLKAYQLKSLWRSAHPQHPNLAPGRLVMSLLAEDEASPQRGHRPLIPAPRSDDPFDGLVDEIACTSADSEHGAVSVLSFTEWCQNHITPPTSAATDSSSTHPHAAHST